MIIALDIDEFFRVSEENRKTMTSVEYVDWLISSSEKGEGWEERKEFYYYVRNRIMEREGIVSLAQSLSE